MNRKDLLERGWIEKKEYWIRKGEYGTWLLTKANESKGKRNIVVMIKKDGEQ